MSKESIIEALEKMTIVEVNELVKELEERWDVSAASFAPVAVAAAPGAGAGEGEAAEKSTFDVVLKEIGDSKLNVIKAFKKGLKALFEMRFSRRKNWNLGKPKGSGKFDAIVCWKTAKLKPSTSSVRTPATVRSGLPDGVSRVRRSGPENRFDP